MSRELDERKAFREAMATYLGTAGWSGITYTDGWEYDETITNPQINVYFVTKKKQELEMGRTSGAKTFPRSVQVDCYMETEARASAVSDDVMDFMELSAITVTDPITSAFEATMVCVDTDAIETVIQPPIQTNPRLLQWRAIVRGPFLAHYPNG